MSATLSAGVKSLILKLDTPVDILRDNDIRDDLIKIKVWCDTSAEFTPSNSNLVFDGLSLSITIPKLADGTELVAGTPYYVKFAFISEIDPNVYTVQSLASATPTTAGGSSVTIIYKRSLNIPVTPAASATTPSTWYANISSIPVGTDPVWGSTGTKASGATNFTWDLPIRMEGVGGIPGDSARIAYKTQSQAISAATTAATVTPNPTTGSSSLPTGWSATVTLPAAGESLWAIDGIYNTPANTVTWGTPYLTQGFPLTIQSDNYNATTLGWQIQRDTGNAYFNNITARGSLVTGNVSAQRIEINKTVTPGTVSTPPIGTNRIEAFRSDNIRFLTIGGSGGTSADTAVIGISANANIINPVWIESSAPSGSNILSNTLDKANAVSAVSSGGGRLFYGNINNTSNPDAAIRIDVDNSISPRTTSGVTINMGNATGSAFTAGGTGDGYAFDAVTGTSGAAGSKSGIGYFRGIDFPTTAGVINVPGTQGKLVVSVSNLTTVGDLTFTIILEGVTYSFIVGYDSEFLNTMAQFASAISAGINNAWQVSTTGTLASGTFVLTKPTIGVLSGTNSISVYYNTGTWTGVLTNGTNTTYTSTPTIVRLKPFTNVATDVLRGDGTWGSVSASGGYSDRRYNVRDYGALGNGSTDDTTAIQTAINTAATTGGVVYFPRGVYNLTSSLTYSAPAGSDPNYRVHFIGEGVGASIIKQVGAGNGLTIAGYSGLPINPNLYTHITDLGFVGSGSGKGLSISNGAYVYVEACWFGNWDYGFYGANFLSSTFSACEFRFNQRGFLVERITGGNYTSSPNAITMLNCEFGANSIYGGWVLGPGVFTMQGGSFEANGTTTGSTSNWGLRISEPSGSTAIESAVGVSLDGVYFEANIGGTDLWISSSSVKPGVTNNISGCSFVRVSSTNYVTANIYLESLVAANTFNNFINGCGFKAIGTYIPDAARPTISNINNKINLVGCSFDSSVDAYVTNDANVFENVVRLAGVTDLNNNPLLNSGTQYQIPYYSRTGTTLSPTNLLTFEDSSLYGNKAGVTDIRLTHNLPGIIAPGVSSTGGNIAIASGFNNTTGSYTAGVLISNQFNSSPSFSGAASGNTNGNASMNLGTSNAPWKTFYWGTNSTGIAAPAGSTTTFLRNDGTWAVPSGGTGTVTSVSGTLPISVATGTTTPVISINAATTSAAGSMSAADKTKLDGIGTGASGVVNAGTVNQLAYYAATGNALSSSSLLTFESTSLFVNKAGVTDIRLTHNLPGIVAPGVSSTGVSVAIASGFNNTTGSYTAGVLISNQFNGAPSFSGAASGIAAGTASMNLGTSNAPWKTFYWGTNSAGIAAPAGSTTTFLRNDGTWVAPTLSLSNTTVTAGSYTYGNFTVDAQGRLTAASSGTAPVTSVTGTAPIVSSGGTTPAISMAAATAANNGYMTLAYAGKLDNIAANATVNTGNVTSSTQYQLGYFAATGTTIAGSSMFTTDSANDSIYINKTGATHFRSSYNLPTIGAPGISSNAVSVAIATGYTGTTYTAGVLVTNVLDGAPSFSGNATSTTTKMNLGTSTAQWGKFYWGTATTGILAPAGATNTYLRNDGTWATPPAVTSITAGTGLSGGTITTTGTISLATTTVTAGSYTYGSFTVDATGRLTAASSGTALVSSVTATAPVVSSGGAAPVISIAAATASINGYMTSTYASKLDGIAAGATVNTGNVTSSTQYQLGYFAATGTTIVGSNMFTTDSANDSIYINKAGATHLRLGYTLGTSLAVPGISTNGVGLAIATGFTGTTYTAGVYITNSFDTAPSFSGNATNTGAVKMNLGTSSAQWGRFYWGSVTAGIAPPSGSTTSFLRNDGTWTTLTTVATSGAYADLTGRPTLATVATSGAYTDLTGKPTLGTLAAQSAITLAQLPTGATATGQVMYWNGTTWVFGGNLFGAFALFNCNSGSALTTNNIGSILGSTTTSITGTYVGTTGSGSTITLDVRTTSPSDIRVKHEITDTDLGLDFINKLRPVSYKLKADPKQQKGYGFIADEVECIIPTGSSLVFYDADYAVGDIKGIKTIHYPSYIAVLTKAVQQLSDKVEALETKLAQQQDISARLAALENKLKGLN